MTKQKDQSTSVTYNTVSFHDSVLPQTLRFAPPYASLASNPEGFSRFWQFAKYAFDLPDPTKFPAFEEPFTDDEQRSFARFIASCRELASYSILSASDGVKMSTIDGVESWEANFSPPELVRAAATLFRQLYNDDDGSYHRVQQIISRRHRETKDEHSEERADYLRQWRRAQGALRQRSVEVIVARKRLDLLSNGQNKTALPNEEVVPTEIISRYLYGDLIHWGDRRVAMAAMSKDPILFDLDRLNFLEALCGLSHFYFGFSVLVDSASRYRSESSA